MKVAGQRSGRCTTMADSQSMTEQTMDDADIPRLAVKDSYDGTMIASGWLAWQQPGMQLISTAYSNTMGSVAFLRSQKPCRQLLKRW